MTARLRTTQPFLVWSPIISNGLMVGMFDTPEDFQRLAALGCVNYGQMTAGGWMYIGPQGIVHGTTITLLNAGRRYLGLQPEEDLRGKVYVTSGLGGMSGAQAKAAVIAGAVGVIAEINPKALHKRHEQGWLQEVETDLVDVAREDGMRAQQLDGKIVQIPATAIDVSEDPAALATCEVILVTVKSGQTEEAGRELAEVVRKVNTGEVYITPAGILAKGVAEIAGLRVGRCGAHGVPDDGLWRKGRRGTVPDGRPGGAHSGCALRCGSTAGPLCRQPFQRQPNQSV